MSDYDFDQLMADYNEAKADKEAAIQEQLEERKHGSQSPKKLSFKSAADVEYEPPKWLIPGYIQRGAITLVAAHPGTGKTAFACGLAACVSSNTPIYDIPIETPGKVLMLSGEDDETVLVGRLDSCGADRKNIILADNIGTSEATMTSPEIEEIIQEEEVKLVIFDPYQLFLGKDVNMNQANETRPVLAKLAEMCKRNDCAAIIVAHQAKNGGDVTASLRALGSVDLPAACRSVLNIVKDPDGGGCIVVNTKNNSAPLAEALTYRFIDRGGILFTGYSDKTIEEIESEAKRKKSRKLTYDTEPLVQVCNQLMQDNPDGISLSYVQFDTACEKILGLIPYEKNSRAGLKKRLDNIKDDLMAKDKIMVETQVELAHHQRGIRLVRHVLPNFYQGNLPF